MLTLKSVIILNIENAMKLKFGTDMPLHTRPKFFPDVSIFFENQKFFCKFVQTLTKYCKLCRNNYKLFYPFLEIILGSFMDI